MKGKDQVSPANVRRTKNEKSQEHSLQNVMK